MNRFFRKSVVWFAAVLLLIAAVPAVVSADEVLTSTTPIQVEIVAEQESAVTFTPETDGLYEFNFATSDYNYAEIMLFRGEEMVEYVPFYNTTSVVFYLESSVTYTLRMMSAETCTLNISVAAAPVVELTLDQSAALTWESFDEHGYIEIPPNYIAITVEGEDADRSYPVILSAKGGVINLNPLGDAPWGGNLATNLFQLWLKPGTHFYEVSQEGLVEETALTLTEPAEATDAVLKDGASVDVMLGTYYWPSFTAEPLGARFSFSFESTPDETVLKNTDNGFLAVGVGSTTLTLTVRSEKMSATKTVTVNVKEPLVWDMNSPLTVPSDEDDFSVYITPEKSGNYAFFSDCTTGDPLVEIYNEDDALIGGSDDHHGYDFYLECSLEKGETYRLEIGNYRSAFDAYPVTAVFLNDTPPSSIAFETNSVTLPLFSKYSPAVTLEPFGLPIYAGDALTFTCDNESVVKGGYGLFAVGAGSATVTATYEDESGTYTAIMTVTVTDAAPIELDKPVSVTVTDGTPEAFRFTAPADGEYSFRSFDSLDDPRLEIYDEEGGALVTEDDTNGYDFFTVLELNKGDTVILSAGTYQSDDSYSLVVSTPVDATIMTISLYDDDYYAKNGDIYFVDINDVSRIAAYALFDGAYGARVEDYYDKVLGTNGSLCKTASYDPSFWVLEPGTSTITFFSKRGLTHTITVVVTDGELLGDVNGDTKIDSTDARLTLQYFVGSINASDLNLATADVDGNGKVDSTDARLILQHFVGSIDKFPAE